MWKKIKEKWNIDKEKENNTKKIMKYAQQRACII